MTDEHQGPCGKYCAVVDECEARGRRIAELEKQEDDICRAFPTARYLDPPDGGDVSLAGQIARMWNENLRYSARIAALEAHINYIESYIEKLIRSHIARADYSEKSSSGRKQRVRASEASGILGVIRAARAAMEK